MQELATSRPVVESDKRNQDDLGVLQQALEQRTVAPGLVHHSDRCVQYVSHFCTQLNAVISNYIIPIVPPLVVIAPNCDDAALLP
jgi:hypothetical protein